MRGQIELRKPIAIDGKDVSILTYDTEKITVDLYLKAINRAVAKGNGFTGANIKLDAGAQLMLGIYAVLAENQSYDVMDVERVSGSDMIKLVDVGTAFILGREDQTPEPSEQQSEPTHKRTTRAQQTSEE